MSFALLSASRVTLTMRDVTIMNAKPTPVDAAPMMTGE